VADKLIEQITAKWTAESSGGQLVQITIRGLSGMKDLVKVKEFLQSQVRGVQTVIQRSFEGGVAVLDVDAKASAQQIGDELAKKDFGALDLDVTGATANTLEVTASRKGAAVSPPPETPKAMVPAPQVAAPPAPPARTAAIPTGDDRHWFQADDYLISERPYERGWIYVELSKLKQPATAQTKGEGQFFNLHDSKDQWTRYFWKTRPAEETDLQVGALAVCFEGNSRDSVYRAPENKSNARTGNWFMGRVTDTSDLYKGTVQIDTYRCSPDALRVPIK
jgi:hypothetical protein